MSDKINPRAIDDQGFPLTELQSQIERVLVRHERYEHPSWNLFFFASHTLTANQSATDNFNHNTLKISGEMEILVYGTFFIITTPLAGASDRFQLNYFDKLVNNNVTLLDSIVQPDFGNPTPPAPFQIPWPWLLKGVTVPYTAQWIPPAEPVVLRTTPSGDTRQSLQLTGTMDATVGSRQYLTAVIYAVRPRLTLN